MLGDCPVLSSWCHFGDISPVVFSWLKMWQFWDVVIQSRSPQSATECWESDPRKHLIFSEWFKELVYILKKKTKPKPKTAYCNHAVAFKTLFVDCHWFLCACHVLKFGSSVKECCLPEASPLITTETWTKLHSKSSLSARLIRALALKGMSSSQCLLNKYVCGV